jgi:hypothetical protein
MHVQLGPSGHPSVTHPSPDWSLWKWGYRGFIPCLAVGLGALVYAMDARLWQPPPDFNLRETVSLVTGANSGLGNATALSLARLGSHVIVTCRSLDKCQQTVQDVNAAGATSGGHATAAVLNLSSLESVDKLVADLSTKYPKIHYLVNNAGSTPILILPNKDSKMALEGCILLTWH